MKEMMEHKGYFGSVHYSDKDNILFGKVEFIRNLLSYEGENISDLKKSFVDAVDDYLTFCEGTGTRPEKSFKGTFNVRLGENLHRKAVLYAGSQKTNLNNLVRQALEDYLNRTTVAIPMSPTQSGPFARN